MSDTWEYTTGVCEQWQVGHLCNYFADKRWEPIQVWPVAPETVQLREHVGDENGPLRDAHYPTMVLFRRVVIEDDEG